LNALRGARQRLLLHVTAAAISFTMFVHKQRRSAWLFVVHLLLTRAFRVLQVQVRAW
jgi:hypothetical protein